MSSTFSSIRALVAAGLVLVGVTSACADVPTFVGQALRPSGVAIVASVENTAYGDFFILSGGAANGYRRGNLLEVLRNGEAIGEVLLVHVDDDLSAGLLMDLKPGTTIREGDITYFKTISNS